MDPTVGVPVGEGETGSVGEVNRQDPSPTLKILVVRTPLHLSKVSVCQDMDVVTPLVMVLEVDPEGLLVKSTPSFKEGKESGGPLWETWVLLRIVIEFILTLQVLDSQSS